jgi:hypothetical protein
MPPEIRCAILTLQLAPGSLAKRKLECLPYAATYQNRLDNPDTRRANSNQDPTQRPDKETLTKAPYRFVGKGQVDRGRGCNKGSKGSSGRSRSHPLRLISLSRLVGRIGNNADSKRPLRLILRRRITGHFCSRRRTPGETLSVGEWSLSGLELVQRDGHRFVHHWPQNACGFPIADIPGELLEQVPVGQRS